ncbi:vacuolar protein sorting-associated protein Vta1p [Monosporozyma unispora]
MINEVSITRILATAKDFDTLGLVIISYYLRLYVVEEILSNKNRPEELTTIASELLDTIEQFKTNVLEQDKNDESNEVIKKLIEDQEKAKIYCVNFTMSLYNEKLTQVSNGPWDVDLKRGLWCCIDLFESILHLWDFESDSKESIRKRIKYCKIYLSQLVKGQLGKKEEEDKEEKKQPITEEDIDNAINDALNETKNEESKINEELSNSHNLTSLNSAEDENEKEENMSKDEEKEESEPKFLETKDETPKDEDIQALIDKLKQQDAMDVDEEDENPEDESSEPTFQLPSAPTKIEKKEITPEAEPEAEPEPEPEFIDEDSEKEEEEPQHHQYTQAELLAMMDKSSKIEKIQKLAKYAISALNYEDTVTAKDQLTQALDILNSMK